MINPAQFITLFGASFIGTIGFFFMFWLAGVVRANIIWFVSMLSLMGIDKPILSAPVIETSNESANDVTNVVNHRSSSVKLVGTLSIKPLVRPVTRLYSTADRERVRASIRVCRVDGMPEMIAPNMNNFDITERRYEPSAAPMIAVNPETLPTSDIFGP